MKKLVTIAKDANIKVKSQIHEFLTPNFVYLPIDEKAQMIATKKKVSKGDNLYQWQGKIYSSPISGTITKIVKLKENLYLEIKNDFKEKDHYTGIMNTTMIVTNDLKKKIKEYNKNWNALKNSETIILNGMEAEPYLANIPFLHKYYMSEILLMLDAIASSYHISQIKIYLKENDRESIEAMEQLINTYPEMSYHILPDCYPIGNSLFLKDYLNLTEKDFLMTSDEIFDAYYELLKLRKKDFLFITITGDAITNPQVVKVKIGTLLKDVVEECIKIKKNSYDIYVNGLFMGYLGDLNIVLTEEIRAIYFMKKNTVSESPCISCGKCNDVCPYNCNPYQTVISKGKWQTSKCISCGLCTFICPSHIPINQLLRRD